MGAKLCLTNSFTIWPIKRDHPISNNRKRSIAASCRKGEAISRHFACHIMINTQTWTLQSQPVTGCTASKPVMGINDMRVYAPRRKPRGTEAPAMPPPMIAIFRLCTTACGVTAPARLWPTSISRLRPNPGRFSRANPALANRWQTALALPNRYRGRCLYFAYFGQVASRSTPPSICDQTGFLHDFQSVRACPRLSARSLHC